MKFSIKCKNKSGKRSCSFGMAGGRVWKGGWNQLKLASGSHNAYVINRVSAAAWTCSELSSLIAALSPTATQSPSSTPRAIVERNAVHHTRHSSLLTLNRRNPSEMSTRPATPLITIAASVLREAGSHMQKQHEQEKGTRQAAGGLMSESRHIQHRQQRKQVPISSCRLAMCTQSLKAATNEMTRIVKQSLVI